MASVRPTSVEGDIGFRRDGATARVVAVLDAVARSPEKAVGVRQLAADLELSRSAVHRILQNLAQLGVVRPMPGGRYEAGPVLASWGAFLAGRHSLLSAARDVMGRLVEAAGETSHLFLYDEGNEQFTVAEACECSKLVRYVLEIGTSAPLHLGAAGKAFLALLPDDHVHRLELGMPATEASAFRKWLREDLELTRERGYAVSFGERIPEAVGVAAGFRLDGRPAGALTITTPQFRMNPADTERFGALVRMAAKELGNLLEVPISRTG